MAFLVTSGGYQSHLCYAWGWSRIACRSCGRLRYSYKELRRYLVTKVPGLGKRVRSWHMPKASHAAYGPYAYKVQTPQPRQGCLCRGRAGPSKAYLAGYVANGGDVALTTYGNTLRGS